MEGMKSWAGKVALVTGASSGIGRATSKRLAEAGMRVMACARRTDALEELAGSTGGEIAVRSVDLRDSEQIGALFAAAKERFGGVDVLVNNAGLGHHAPLMSGETSHWREMLEVNVLALCVCTREAVQDMQARGVAGHVIHVSSMAAHRVPRGSGVYSATEFAARYHGSEAAAAETYGRFPVLQAGDVAEAVVYVLGQPAHVQVHDVLMRPTDQPS